MKRYPFLIWLAVILGSIALGFYLTQDGLIVWDDLTRYRHSQWLLTQYGLANALRASGSQYAALWELLLGLGTNYVFHAIQDVYWVRHALTFSLFPIALYTLYKLLRRVGCDNATALLGICSIYGTIRLGGHSLLNVKDAPAALVVTLVSVGLWLLLKRWYESKNHNRFGFLIGIGALSVLPLVIRIPLAHYVALTAGFFVYYLLLQKDTREPWYMRLLYVAVPICTALLIFYTLYPLLWFNGHGPAIPADVVQSASNPINTFANYHRNNMYVVSYGELFTSGSLPWWYAFGWIPVIAHPTLFLASIAGLYTYFIKRESNKANKRISELANKQQFLLSTKFGSFNLSFIRWLLLINLVTWAATLVTRPVLYDEERQILFLYPTLFLLCLLGFQHLQAKWKYIIAGIIFIASTWSYSQWQEFSYIYKSPITGYTSSKDFTGDYWQLCISQGIHELSKNVPKQTPIVIDGQMHIVNLQESRLHTRHTFLKDVTLSSPIALLTADSQVRTKYFPIVKKYARFNSNTILWRRTLPTGEDICLLALYNNDRPKDLQYERVIIK